MGRWDYTETSGGDKGNKSVLVMALILSGIIFLIMFISLISEIHSRNIFGIIFDLSMGNLMCYLGLYAINGYNKGEL